MHGPHCQSPLDAAGLLTNCITKRTAPRRLSWQTQLLTCQSQPNPLEHNLVPKTSCPRRLFLQRSAPGFKFSHFCAAATGDRAQQETSLGRQAFESRAADHFEGSPPAAVRPRAMLQPPNLQLQRASWDQAPDRLRPRNFWVPGSPPLRGGAVELNFILSSKARNLHPCSTPAASLHHACSTPAPVMADFGRNDSGQNFAPLWRTSRDIVAAVQGRAHPGHWGSHNLPFRPPPTLGPTLPGTLPLPPLPPPPPGNPSLPPSLQGTSPKKPQRTPTTSLLPPKNPPRQVTSHMRVPRLTCSRVVCVGGAPL